MDKTRKIPRTQRVSRGTVYRLHTQLYPTPPQRENAGINSRSCPSATSIPSTNKSPHTPAANRISTHIPTRLPQQRRRALHTSYTIPAAMPAERNTSP